MLCMTGTADEIRRARAYYRKILPFYRKESVSRAHLQFWLRMARRTRPGRILEIGSGLGRITAELSRVAPSVGVDISIEMLLEAAGTRCGLFVAADARRPPFRHVFDLVVAPGDPFSHLTTLVDRRRALRAVAAQLTPTGRFVLDGLYRRRHQVAYPRRRIRDASGVLEIDEAWFPAGLRDLWSARYRYVERRRGGKQKALSANFMARSWNRRTIRAEFEACGLTILTLWGDFDGRPFGADARRIVAVSRRSA